MRRHLRIRIGIIIAGVWLIVNAVIGVGILNVWASHSGGIFSALQRVLQLISIWGAISAVLLLLNKEIGRRMTVIYCGVELALALIALAIRGARWLYFGTTAVDSPELNIVQIGGLRQIMANIYTIAILIFLTRPNVMKFFQTSKTTGESTVGPVRS